MGFRLLRRISVAVVVVVVDAFANRPEFGRNSHAGAFQSIAMPITMRLGVCMCVRVRVADGLVCGAECGRILHICDT